MTAVRAMTEADRPALADLFAEMQAHYRVPCPPREEVLADLARLPQGCAILVAVEDGLVGFAAVCTVFPGPGLRAGLFLKELYVAQAARGGGVGAALMRAVAARAVAHGLSRVDWTADRTNARLLAFYRDTGATALEDKLFFRLDGAGLAALAEG